MNVSIRVGRIEDAERILEIQRTIVNEGKYFLSVEEEFNRTEVQHREWIEKMLTNEREIIFIAEVDHVVVGWIAFQSNHLQRLSHVGSFGMAVSDGHRGFGIGKMLINELLNWAVQNPHIEKVSLGVLSTNHRAIMLYKQLGFVEEGRRMKEIKLNENEYADDILMYKMV
ncbi:GNAT family N-acetyltransferase [Bacillus solimangrovi]|uniref:GNAT family N-acetyltransferase n=1 Tax=Bacillus solimangrovi TaxID=1305675 RepID=A0A1E5LE12_9BACI|nr:N-acetyltransferase [Bacillus solimangrovi]OEH92335.1 GNAT family N-acetyltransferase [Bacillus solimangrovi]